MSILKFIKNGNIFNTSCETMVCPVNCYGVMDGGLAHLFDKYCAGKYDEQNMQYKTQCKTGMFSVGSCLLTHSEYCDKKVIYLATKFHHSDNSKIENIVNALVNLNKCINTSDIKSIAIPAIGCGLGSLPWPSVEIVMKQIFYNDGNKDNIVEVYEPLQ